MARASNERDFFELVQEGHYSKRVLVEGDSWVSHPQLSNLTIKFDELGRNDWAILNIASPGDEAREILQPNGPQFKKLIQLIHDERWGYRWDMVFLSAGGNDIVGPEIIDFVEPKGTGGKEGRELINASFGICVSKIQGHYQAFIERRDESLINRETPIVTHVYSYPKPRPKGTKLFGFMSSKGWIYTHLVKHRGFTNADVDEMQDIINAMLEKFRDAMVALQDNHEGFMVVDTLGVLSQNGGFDPSVWHDEIHPNSTGFGIVADKIRDQAAARQSWPV